jgi:multidrug efflux pump subunit AcrA (membrane-fusion protein)
MTIFPDDDPNRARRPWWRERRVIFTAGAIVVLVAAVVIWRGCHSAPAEAGGDIVVSVQVAKAERGTIANEISTVATLSPIREATIMPKLAAQIAQMPLMTNRSVRAGDVIATLESRDLTAQRAEAAAALQEAETSAAAVANGNVPLTNAQDTKSVRDAKAALDNAERTYERRKVLFEQGGISKKDLEASQLAVTNAQDDLRLAEASSSLHHGVLNPGDIRVADSKTRQARNRLGNLDAQLGYTTIRAPFNGVITAQFQYQGDMANPGAKLVTIADTSTLIAKMQLAEETATKLKAGDAVRVMPDDLAGQVVAGTISLVGRGADPQSRSVEVWVMVPNPAGRLRANGVARVVISAQPVNDAVIVPSAAVTLDATNGNSGTVMVVDAKSIAHEVHVTAGIRSAGRTQITAGLNGGETVVTEGNYGLPDGTKVVVPSADEKPASPSSALRVPSPRNRGEGGMARSLAVRWQEVDWRWRRGGRVVSWSSGRLVDHMTTRPLDHLTQDKLRPGDGLAESGAT